jgi:OOP family OmpA-OmpF porin
MLRLAAIPLLGLLVGAAPLAAQHAGQFEVSAAAGYHRYGSATELESQFGFAARLGYWLYGPLSLEGEFTYARPQPTNDAADRVTATTLAGWLLANLPVGTSGSVFLKGGYGSTSYGNCPDIAIPDAGPCGSVGVLQGGAGARVAIMPSVQLRIDGILNTSLSSRKFSNAVIQGGLTVLLGAGGGSNRAPKPRITDPDADGVPDTRDRCPGTPRGARVDAVGCSHDVDGDLVPDGVDACPDTPAGVAVDSTGCPKPAAAPAEPPAAAVSPAPIPAPIATPAPVKPDSAKAPAARPDSARASVPKPRVVVLPGTIWNYRASAINASGLPGLDSVVRILRENPSLVAEVQGYAHDRLVPSDNTLLSQRRAEAIKSYIVSKGVTAGRVTAVGKGSQTLLVSDTTDAARITNRRVEVHLLKRP